MELLRALRFKLKQTKKRGGRKPATTAHRVAGVTIFRSRALGGRGQERGPRGSGSPCPGGSAPQEGKGPPGPLRARQLRGGGAGAGNRFSQQPRRGKAGAQRAGRKGREPSPRAAPDPGRPSTARRPAPRSRRCATTREAGGSAAQQSGPLALSRAPQPRQGTHPRRLAANSRRLPRRPQRRARRTPGVPAGPSRSAFPSSPGAPRPGLPL